MAATDASPSPVHRRAWPSVARWVREEDPGLSAVKRSVRAALVMPLVFGLAHLAFSNPQVSLFGAFGSFALLLLADIPGRPRTRLFSYVALFLVGGCLISLGTVVSTNKVAAVLAMAGVGFAVLFAGILSPQAATASTAALLTFVLPVAVAQPPGAVGPRLVGWALAGALCIPACMVIWPPPWHDHLRRRLSATVSAVAALTAAHAGGRRDPGARIVVDEEVSQLRQYFAATPYPAAGAATGAVALAKLVGRVEWLTSNATLVEDATTAQELSAVQVLLQTASDTLRLSASLICDRNDHPVDDPRRIADVQRSARELERLIAAELDTDVSTLIELGSGREMTTTQERARTGMVRQDVGMAFSLDPSFHARALGIATVMVADAALAAGGAEPAGDGAMGLDRAGQPRQLWSRLSSHLSLRSVWFRNAVRGAVGLALAVAVVEITDVEHGFWVVLGTLSVLRSNALTTGSTALRAVGGTAVGFVVGSAIMIGVGGHSAALWVILPIAVLVSGVAPSMISFAAGQAGFTIVVVILFNIIEPSGWKVGLTRIEDVVIGSVVSVVVGLLFWPRGATAALGRALSDAFIESSGYLADAVDRLTTPARVVDTGPALRAAQGAYLRLDDAFRQFLAERGAKVVPVEIVANLFTGSNRIRMAAYTLANQPTLPPEPGQSELESVAIAGAVLRDSYASSHRWYEEFGEMLADRRDTLDPPPVQDEILHDVLREAFDDAKQRRRADRLRATIQMLWADQLLETQRPVQIDLARSADLFAHRRHRGPMA